MLTEKVKYCFTSGLGINVKFLETEAKYGFGKGWRKWFT